MWLTHGVWAVLSLVLALSCLDPYPLAPMWDGSACAQVGLDPRPPSVARTVVVTGAGQFPSLASRGDTLFLLFRGRGAHLDLSGRLDLMRSLDGGRSWQDREVVADSPLDDRNGAIGVGRQGEVVVGYAVFDGYDTSGRPLDIPRSMDTWVVVSHDGARTWSLRQRLDSSPYRAMSPYGQIIVLHDGRLLMSVYVARDPRGPWSAAYVTSGNGGTSWSGPRLIASHHDETSMIVLKDGTWLAAMRNEGDAGITLVRSNDDGATWGPNERATERAEVPGDLVALDDSTVWLTYGHRLPPYGVAGRLSTDRGRSWSPPITLMGDGLGPDGGYPSSVVLASGEVLTAYYQEASVTFPMDGRHAAVLRYSPLLLACVAR